MTYKKIKVLTFDLDDTLWECFPVIEKAETTLREWLAVHYPKITQKYTVKQFIDYRIAIAERNARYSHDFNYLRKAQLFNGALDCGYDKKTAEIIRDKGFEIFINERSNVVLFDDVLPTFTILQKYFTLGALTNGNVDLTKTKLKSFFNFTLNASTAGFAKPDPRFFRQACQLAEVECSEIVHIGDHPVQDIDGAVKVGIDTIWLNRNKSNWPDLPKPNNTINSLVELPGLLLNL